MTHMHADVLAEGAFLLMRQAAYTTCLTVVPCLNALCQAAGMCKSQEGGSVGHAGISAATAAAAAGGVSTLFEMPLNSNPPTTTLLALKAKQALVKVPLSLLFSCTLHST